MNHSLKTGFIAVVFSLTCSTAIAETSTNIPVLDQDAEALPAEAQKRIGVFAKKLKKTLKTAINEKGFEYATKVCNESAPKIAAELSTDGWTLSRTSFRVRNDGNEPAPWQLQTLSRFDAKIKAAKQSQPASPEVKPPMLDEYSVHTDEQSNEFRYMKPIKTAGLCLQCHGDNVEPGLKAKIDQLYPNDHAVGFKLGDLRGAFVAVKALDKPAASQ